MDCKKVETLSILLTIINDNLLYTLNTLLSSLGTQKVFPYRTMHSKHFRDQILQAEK